MVFVVHNTFSAIWVAEWSPLLKLLPLHFHQDLNLISKYCLGTYDNFPAQYTTLFHVKRIISHDNMKYFLPILLKQ